MFTCIIATLCIKKDKNQSNKGTRICNYLVDNSKLKNLYVK
jgi:hypothetical protein